MQLEAYKFVLDWALQALARGRHTEQRHNEIAFRSTETSLLAYACEKCVRGAVLYLKADLAELGATFGFPSSAAISYPCMFCDYCYVIFTHLKGWDAMESQRCIYSSED